MGGASNWPGPVKGGPAWANGCVGGWLVGTPVLSLLELGGELSDGVKQKCQMLVRMFRCFITGCGRKHMALEQCQRKGINSAREINTGSTMSFKESTTNGIYIHGRSAQQGGGAGQWTGDLRNQIDRRNGTYDMAGRGVLAAKTGQFICQGTGRKRLARDILVLAWVAKGRSPVAW